MELRPQRRRDKEKESKSPDGDRIRLAFYKSTLVERYRRGVTPGEESLTGPS